MKKAINWIQTRLPRFCVGAVTFRFFCSHLQWQKTGKILGSKLYEHKCLKCGKSIYRDRFNPLVSFFENGR